MIRTWTEADEMGIHLCFKCSCGFSDFADRREDFDRLLNQHVEGHGWNPR